jgi:hypothetical protein
MKLWIAVCLMLAVLAAGMFYEMWKAEMTERENGWHCPGCNEEVEAANAREAESNKRADRIARRWAWRF